MLEIFETSNHNKTSSKKFNDPKKFHKHTLTLCTNVTQNNKILVLTSLFTIPLFLQLIPEHEDGIWIHLIFWLLSLDFFLVAKCRKHDLPNGFH